MDHPPETSEALVDCLDDWSNPEARERVEQWLSAHPGDARILAEQRAVDLGLRSRAGCDASHRLLRERILLSIHEQAAPLALRESIFSAVQAEAKRNVPFARPRPSRVRELWDQLCARPARRWAVAFTAFALLVSVAWIVISRNQTAPAPDVAFIETVSGPVQGTSRGRSTAFGRSSEVKAGDSIQVGSNGTVALMLTNGTRLHAGPNTELSSATATRDERQSWMLQRGILKAEASPTSALNVTTPELSVLVSNGSFNLERTSEATWLHVTRGTAFVGRSVAHRLSVGAGQMVEIRTDASAATPLRAMAYERDLLEWPFDSSSPWNVSIGSGAMPARIRAPGWPPQSLTNTVLIRPIFISRPDDPRVNFISPGEEPRGIRYPETWRPVFTPGEFVCGLFPQDRICCEMTEPVRLPSGDVRARERNSTDLTGSGVGWSWPRPRSIGGSAFAGLIRRGELTFGIQHALALAVNARFLNSTGGVNGHRWPGVPVAPELSATFGQEGNLVLGALLVLHTNVDLASLGVGTSGPGFEIARALQDYGAYIIQTTDGDVKLIAAADAGLPPDIDAIVDRLVPRLVLVSNSSTRNVGGGGIRRRPPAPPLAW